MVVFNPWTNTEDRMQLEGDTKDLPIDKTVEQVTKLDNQLGPEEEKLIIEVIHKNKDLFTWTTTYLPNIHLEVMSHKMAQKKRKIGEE